MRLLVTGATGFVGGAVARRMAPETSLTRGAVRSAADLPSGVEPARVSGLAADSDWSSAVSGIDAVVHAAARVHVMHERAADPLAEFRRVNVDGTAALARQAARAGVERFVFVSSVKVNGERTEPGRPFSTADAPAPVDPYGISKLEAEQRLNEIAGETGLQVVIIRPVLVYGPGVKGNFRSMMRWVRRGIPLPFGAVRNLRSLVALDNLVDLVRFTLQHRDAPGRVFFAADGEDLSTPDLLRRTGAALGRPARLIPVPPGLIRAAAGLAGMGDVAQRLCGSLQVDIGDARSLGWTPPVTVAESLRVTARHFLAEQP